jgi:uncharacterized membrane protein
MSKVKYPAVFFFFVVIFSFVMPLYYYKNLPVRVASHFNINNNADTWMSRESFIYIQVIITIILSVMFLFSTLLIKKLPESIINLPNKEYWMHDDRKGVTYSVFQRFMFWFGSLTLMLIDAILLEVYSSNISGISKISSFVWIYLAAYLLTAIFLTVKMITYFTKPGQS